MDLIIRNARLVGAPHTAPTDIGATAAVTVTLENAAGASRPTSQPLLIARLDARQ